MLNLLKHVKPGVDVRLIPASVAVFSDDKELIEEFLRLVKGLNQEDVARRVSEVKQHDVSRWRRGAFKRLSEKKRAAVLAYIEGHWNGGKEETPEDAVAAVGGSDYDPGSDPDVQAFGDLVNVARTLRSIGPPGIGEQDKRGALDAIADFYAHVGKRRPKQWWDLDELLRAGKI
jgi:hypothetical protein